MAKDSEKQAAQTAPPLEGHRTATATQPATGGDTKAGGPGKPTKARAAKAAAPGKSQSQTRTDKPAEKPEKSNVNQRLSKLEDMLQTVLQALPLQNVSASHQDSEMQPRVAYGGSSCSTGAAVHTAPLTATQPGGQMRKDDESDSEMGQIGEEEDELYLSPETVPPIAAKFAVTSDIGGPVEETIAQSANYLLTHQLEQKVLDETAAKYPLPSNCQAVDTPKVNPIIWDNLPTHTKTRDLKLQRIQKSLTRGLNAFIHTLSSETLTEPQQDVLAMLCNTNFELNCVRKDLIKPDLNARYTHLCKPENPVTKLLFGDNLSKKVKDMNDEQKATAGVMKGQRKPQASFQYHPYKTYKPSMTHGYDRQRTYKDAGWTRSRAPATATRPNSGSGNRPFLGQAGGRQSHPPPMQSQKTANKGQRTPQNQRTR